MSNLNKQQEEASSHMEGPCFVSAVPGSGKTKCLVERTVRLIRGGISPRSILSLTFTNKAANEMKHRVSSIVGDDVSQHIHMSTFHALAANVLRKMGGSIGYGSNMTIYDSDDQESLMAQVLRQIGHEVTAPVVRSIVWKLNELRENLVDESSYDKEFHETWMASAAIEYTNKLRSKSAVDFSGLLSEFMRLLDSDSHVLNKLHNRFSYFQLDESQDTNYVQFKIFETLGSNGNMFIVGDKQQSIYGWRGARYQNIQDFITKYKAKIIYLPLNYRSTPEIITVASNLIKHNTDCHKDYEFLTENKSGDPVECIALPTPELEGKWIGQCIKSMIEAGVKPEDIAVLYRLNSMSRSIESGLVQSQVPYQIIGGHGFYDRKEVKDGLAMLRFLVNPFDGIALSRFINKPKRGIGEGMLGKIETFAEQNSIDLIQSMKRASEYLGSESVIKDCYEIGSVFEKNYKNCNIGEVLTNLLNDLHYDEYLKTDKDMFQNYDDRKDNQQELVNSAAMYSDQRSADISAYLNNIALSTSSDKKTEDGQVSLMTMHASKGLEFPIVFLPRLEDGQMPHKRAMDERPDGLEEERRLMYVAMTRAEKNLICTFAKKSMMKYGKGGVQFVHNIPSRFISESKLTVLHKEA